MQELECFIVSVKSELAMASSEPSTSRLPEEDSSVWIMILIMRFHKLTLIVKSTSIRSSMSAKKRLCVYFRQYAKTFPWATTSRKGSSFAFCMKCSRDINLGRGGTRDLRRHQETKLHKHPEKDGVHVLFLQSYFGSIRGESVIRTEVLFAYFLGEHHLAFQLGDHCTKVFKLMFPDSSIAKDFSAVVLKQPLC